MEELHNVEYLPAYKWKSVHVETELVRLGLEQKYCSKPFKTHSRHVLACHLAAVTTVTKPSPSQQTIPHHHQQRRPALIGLTAEYIQYRSKDNNEQQLYFHSIGDGHDRDLLDDLLVKLRTQPIPPQTGEQHGHLIQNSLDQSPIDTSPQDLKQNQYSSQHRYYDGNIDVWDAQYRDSSNLSCFETLWLSGYWGHCRWADPPSACE